MSSAIANTSDSEQAGKQANKHADRSARTRARFVAAAQELFAERSIDSVSLNEITQAAGQKNRNALQYHFGNREGLLQAIIDSHAPHVHALRQDIIDEIERSGLAAPQAAARALVEPLYQYVQQEAEGIHYIKILSQMAVFNSPMLSPDTSRGFTFRRDKRMNSLFAKALENLPAQEAQRRVFLTVSITFHSIADVCRSTEGLSQAAGKRQRAELFEQVILAIESLLAAPSAGAAS